MKKQNVFMNIITAAALFGCGFAVFGWVSAKHPKEVVAPADDPAPQVTLTVETLEELIEPCSKLITATDKYTNKDTLEKDTKDPIFNLHIWGSTEIVHYSYIGTIQAGLNLKDVHFTIDDTSKKALEAAKKMKDDDTSKRTIQNSKFAARMMRNMVQQMFRAANTDAAKLAAQSHFSNK